MQNYMDGVSAKIMKIVIPLNEWVGKTGSQRSFVKKNISNKETKQTKERKKDFELIYIFTKNAVNNR